MMFNISGYILHPTIASIYCILDSIIYWNIEISVIILQIHLLVVILNPLLLESVRMILVDISNDKKYIVSGGTVYLMWGLYLTMI